MIISSQFEDQRAVGICLQIMEDLEMQIISVVFHPASVERSYEFYTVYGRIASSRYPVASSVEYQ